MTAARIEAAAGEGQVIKIDTDRPTPEKAAYAAFRDW